jgi:hypothetical protein
MSEKANKTFETDACNIRLQPLQHVQTIYFCIIHIKHLQRTSETSETIETYSCNMLFQCNISLLLDEMEARRCVVFTGGSGPAALVDVRPAIVAARRGRGASAARAARRLRPRNLERAAARRAWQGQRLCAATQRRPYAMPDKASGRTVFLGGGRVLRLGGMAASEWIRVIGRGTSG